MADINLGSTVAPGGPFPIARDTDLFGGMRVVADLTARNAIIAANQSIGMRVVVRSPGSGIPANSIYQLVSTGPAVWLLDTSTADWTVGTGNTFRHFAVDFDAGSDANAGFSDANGAAAGLVAKKTWAGLLAILPRDGAGRCAHIMIKPRAAGASYGEAFELLNYRGYRKLYIRATNTVTSAGAVAFANSVNDEICCGGRIATGFNTAGYKFAKIVTSFSAAPTNASPVVITHSGAATFETGDKVRITSSSFAIPVVSSGLNATWTVTVIDATHFSLNNSDGTSCNTFGAGGTITTYRATNANDDTPAILPGDSISTQALRIRGDIATTTVANRNAVRYIFHSSAGTTLGGTIIPDTDISTVNAADIWYIEEPDATFTSINVSLSATAAPNSTTFLPGMQLFGIRSSGSLAVYDSSDVRLGFLFASANSGFQIRNTGSFSCDANYVSSTANINRVVGGGIQAAGATFICDRVTSVIASNVAVAVGQGFQFTAVRALNVVIINEGGNTASVNGCGGALGGGSLAMAQISGRLPMFLTLTGSNCAIQGQSAETASSSPRTLMRITGGGGFYIIGITDQRATFDSNDLGIDFSNNQIGIGNTALIQQTCMVRVTLPTNGRQKPEIGLTNGNGTQNLLIRDLSLQGLRTPKGDFLYSVIGSSGSPFTRGQIGAHPSSSFTSTNATAIPKGSLIRTTGTPVTDSVALAKADSAANCAGLLLVAQSSVFVGTAGREVLANATGFQWLIPDDTPLVNDIVYLSTANAGQIMKAVPTVSGTNQKLRLGKAVITLTLAAGNFTLVDFRPEMLSVNADGNP